MKLVAYLRISTDGQRENTSMDTQYERIAAYCAYNRHDIMLVAHDVETASGKKRRPGLELALEQIYNGHADGLICLKLDRFARSTIEGLKIAAELRHRGKQLVLLNENLDTSNAVGECIFTILLAFAQLEHATIVDRCASGKDKVRERRGYVEGMPPFGYMASKDEYGNKVVIRHPEQYAWRKQIFAWRAEGWSQKRIADELNSLAVTSRGGGIWYQSTVRHLFNHTRLAEWAEELYERNQERQWTDSAS